MQNIIFDIETYPNYILFGFKSECKTHVKKISLTSEDQTLSDDDRKWLIKLLSNYPLIGFNSNKFDIPILLYALKKGVTCADIYDKVQYLINDDKSKILMPWDFDRKFQLPKIRNINHVDLMEVAPGVGISLKLYGARMGLKKLQELPIPPGTYLTPERQREIEIYWDNDADTTIELFKQVKSKVDLRGDISKELHTDVRSKSDAQLAESYFRKEILDRTGEYPKKINVKGNEIYKYKSPLNISFENETLRNVYKVMNMCDYTLSEKDALAVPLQLKDVAKFEFDGTKYKVGIGGLHSREKDRIIRANDEWLICERDVASYYPNIILNNKLYPKHLGSNFLGIYKSIVDKRLHAKRTGDKITNESLKITINGAYGKFGSKYSFLFSPNLVLGTTLTGQLSLLMLIEMLAFRGIKTVSANTDGFVCMVKKSEYDLYDSICKSWEKLTNYELEETQYKYIVSESVNSYCGLTVDGYEKLKGSFAESGLMTSPKYDICYIAVREFFKNGTLPEDTIFNCTDITKFMIVKKAKRGAYQNGILHGKLVRWYYSLKGDYIYTYGIKGELNTKVAESESSKILMDLPSELPKDLDVFRYVDIAYKILNKFKEVKNG